MNLATAALHTMAALAIARATDFPKTDIQKFCSVLAYDTLVDEAYCIELEEKYRSMALQEWLRASEHKSSFRPARDWGEQLKGTGRRHRRGHRAGDLVDDLCIAMVSRATPESSGAFAQAP